MFDCAANDIVQEIKHIHLEEALNQQDLNLKTENYMEMQHAYCSVRESYWIVWSFDVEMLPTDWILAEGIFLNIL